MKKFIVLLLAALMIVGLCISCKEDPKPTFNIVGTWETSYEESYGTVVTTLELKDDKSFSVKTYVDEELEGSGTGTYEAKDGKLILTLDEASSAHYANETITESYPLYFYLKNFHPETDETAWMGDLHTEETIDEILVNKSLPPRGFLEYSLDIETLTLSYDDDIDDFYISYEYTIDSFDEEVSKIDFNELTEFTDDSGILLSSMEIIGHYDVAFVGQPMNIELDVYYIFCEATKDNVSEVILTSKYEEVDATHFKSNFGGPEEITFTKK